MPRFAYVGIEVGTGRQAGGAIVARNQDEALAELRGRGLALTSLVQQPVSRTEDLTPGPWAEPVPAFRKEPSRKAPQRGFWSRRTVGPKTLMLFTRQLAMLLKAGLPLHRALEVLARPERSQSLRSVILGLAETIRSGGSFSDGLRQSPQIFSELYVAMITAGEAGGVLDTVLDRLARFLERTERIRGRIKAAMMYPVIILVVAGGIFAGLLVFVVPKFEQIFQGVLKGQPLPALTRAVLGVAEVMRHHFPAAMAVAVVAGVVWRLGRRTRRGTSLADWCFIKAPVVGDLLLKASIARFTRTFGSLLASGVPMLEALATTRATSANVHIEGALVAVQGKVKSGGTVAQSLEATGVFPNLVTSMIDVGEQTGALPEMLGRIADAYDEEVDLAVAALTSIIEPILIVLMALVVGVIVVALFLPLVGIVQHLQ